MKIRPLRPDLIHAKRERDRRKNMRNEVNRRFSRVKVRYSVACNLKKKNTFRCNNALFEVLHAYTQARTSHLTRY